MAVLVLFYGGISSGVVVIGVVDGVSVGIVVGGTDMQSADIKIICARRVFAIFVWNFLLPAFCFADFCQLWDQLMSW